MSDFKYKEGAGIEGLREIQEAVNLKETLDKNSDKNFVQRILNPENHGVLKNEDGSHSTHSMAWGQAGEGKYIVFPTVVSKDGGLKRLSDREAFKHAAENKEAIVFDNPEEAEWFSKNYKKYWDITGKRPK